MKEEIVFVAEIKSFEKKTNVGDRTDYYKIKHIRIYIKRTVDII